MNILPKKRWHVRTKENIARVRKDEAEAAEKERQEKLRIENADREARLNVLKYKSKQRLLEAGVKPESKNEAVTVQHINLFEDLEHATQKTNKDHDKETKEEKEKYEKQIGYLTYLGQDTNEALKKKNWYEVLPGSSNATPGIIKDSYDKLVLKDKDGKPKVKEIDEKNGEIAWKAKQCLDPLNDFKQYCPPKFDVSHKVIHQNVHRTDNKDNNLSIMDKLKDTKDKYYHQSIEKRHKKNSKKEKHEDKKNKLQKLREARLKRELQEKHKTEQFLIGLNKSTSINCERQEIDTMKIKYNSQFNPSLARQNYR